MNTDKLACEIVPLREVMLSVVEDFISFHYGVPYSADYTEEFSEDQSEFYFVSGTPEFWMGSKGVTKAEEVRARLAQGNGYGYAVLSVLLNDLCARGFVDAGFWRIKRNP